MTAVELTPGDSVGECMSCGIVVSDEISSAFPNPSDCPKCGTELTAEKVVAEQRTVDASYTPSLDGECNG